MGARGKSIGMGVKLFDNIVYKKTEEIIPYEGNPRINGRAIDALVEVIPEFGFNQPIVIDRNNVIIKGHSRYEAMKRMGCEAIPCIVTDNDDEINAENRLLDNKLHELSEWDSEKLNCELREMKIDLRSMKVDVPAVKGSKELSTDVQQRDIAKAESKLITERKPTSSQQDLIEVHCEYCGESFFVSRVEVEKYA